MAVEIERKFLINEKPFNIEQYPKHIIEQGYLNISPAIRVRKDDDSYILTYKGEKTDGGIGRTEYNMPLTKEAYENLIKKSDGNIIKKHRYIIPLTIFPCPKTLRLRSFYWRRWNLPVKRRRQPIILPTGFPGRLRGINAFQTHI